MKMKKIIFDFSYITSLSDFYQQLGKRILLPNYFGNNLDALWDIIISGNLPMPIEIVFRHFTYKPIFDPLIVLFTEAQQQLNGDLVFTVLKE